MEAKIGLVRANLGNSASIPLLFSFLILFSPLGFAESPSKKYWHFTKADFVALHARGGDFQLAADSAWLPPAYWNAIKATLSWVMDPSLSPPAADELSLQDFFHGHISCPKGGKAKEVEQAEWDTQPLSRRLQQLRDEYYFAAQSLHRKAIGMSHDSVEAETLPAFTLAVQEINRRAGALLRTVQAEKLCPSSGIIVFHTFEDTFPKTWQPGDPRRNLMTRVDSPSPHRFVLTDPGAASNFLVDYLEIVYFSFIVDPQGQVHVAAGAEDALSPVLGVAYHRGMGW